MSRYIVGRLTRQPAAASAGVRRSGRVSSVAAVDGIHRAYRLRNARTFATETGYLDAVWVLFQVPCPTQDGRTAEELYEKRVALIDAAMKANARELGCTFHRAWHAVDGSAFYALAHWRSAEGARAFFERWHVEAEPGEVAIELTGDVGLVPLGGGPDAAR